MLSCIKHNKPDIIEMIFIFIPLILFLFQFIFSMLYALYKIAFIMFLYFTRSCSYCSFMVRLRLFIIHSEDLGYYGEC